MDRIDRIIKYIENEMTAEEKITFEEELKSSAELQKELENHLLVKNTTSYLKQTRLNQKYLDSIIPEFRSGLEKYNRVTVKRNLGFAFGTLIISILTMLTFNNYFSTGIQSTDLEQFAQSLNEDQKIEVLELVNGHYPESDVVSEYISDRGITDLLSSDIEINDEIAETYGINYNEIISGLNVNEVNEIYFVILNQEF